MKFRSIILVASATFILSGCGDKAARSDEKKSDPTFMFWCFRKEIVSDEFHIPEMKTQAVATYIQNHLKSVPGYTESSFDLSSQTMTVSYKSSTVRKMNFEEAIALSGFATQHRPANPNAKIPAGVK